MLSWGVRTKSADEIVSDSLLIAMVLKRLPEDYKTFSAIVSQRDEKEGKMKFQEFNSHLGVTRRRRNHVPYNKLVTTAS